MNSGPGGRPLDERAQHLLRTLIDLYIDEGAPVGSKRLAHESRAGVSSATIRNVMVELEDRGLVASPHTSAGRVPTPAGYRFFVDSLLAVQPLDDATVQHLRGTLSPDLQPKALVESASRLLSDVTRLAGVVMLPRRPVRSLRQVEFLPLSNARVLVILVINDHEVENRVIHTDREYTEAELQQAANLINREFAGRSLLRIRTDLLESMRNDRDRMGALMDTALDVAGKAFEVTGEPEGDDYVVAGETRLLQFAGESGVDTVQALFDAFSRKRDILHLLDRSLQSDGVQLFIGRESGHGLLEDYSVVTRSYEVDGRIAGVLGVIGPTRMAYQRVIPVVDATARMLSAAMSRLS